MDFYVPILLAVVASAIITGLILIFVLRKQRERRRHLMEVLGEDLYSGEGLIEGVTYRYIYTEGSKNTPSSFRLYLDCPSEGGFKVARETGFDRWAEKLGINVEVKTGDREFDDAFYLTTDDVEFARSYFGQPDKRQAIREIFEEGFERIEHDGERLSAIISPFKPAESFSKEAVERAADRLVHLSRHLPQAGIISGIRSRGAYPQGWKTLRVVAFAIPILLAAAGFIALLIGVIDYTPLDGWALALGSLKYSVPALALYIWLAFRLLKGRSSSHRELVIVILIAVEAFLVGGAGLRILLNGYLDTAEAAQHSALVVYKYITTSDDDDTYHTIVSSWRPGRETEKIRVSEYEYERITPGNTTMIVETRPGRFGFEWIASHRVR